MRHGVVHSFHRPIRRASSRCTTVARFIVSLWLLAPAGRLAAAPDYFEFQGTVLFPGQVVFNVPVNPNDPITGGFNLDRATAIPKQPTSANRQDFRVQRFHGFFALFGGIEVRADEFEIQVINDSQPQGAPTASDIVTLLWDSSLVPAPAPLYVNGVPRTVGKFALSFSKDGGEAFMEPTLAALDLLQDFDKSFSTLGDSAGPFVALGRNDAWNRLPGLPGDFDEDSDADGNDFLTWQQAVGTLAQGDLTKWKSYFGSSDQTPEASPVPEPASASAAATLVALSAWIRQRRRRA